MKRRHMPNWVIRYSYLASWVTLVIVCVFLWRDVVQAQRTADETHAAGCALRGDLIQRAQGTLDYINDQPPGTTQVFGVPLATLSSRAQDQLQSAHTLDRLHCDAQ